MLLQSELCVRTISGSGQFCPDQLNAMTTQSLLIPNYFLCAPNSYRFSFQFVTLRATKKPKSALLSCKKHRRNRRFDPKSHHHDPDDEYLEASLLISETAKHYNLWRQGFREELKQLPGQYVPFSAQVKDLRADVNPIGLGILLRFQNPTIFLKISCDGDFLFPISVGEFAVEKLIHSLNEDDDGDYPNPFQFVRNLVSELDYEVTTVKITKRVVNTYFASVCFGKVGERENFSLDARPSDAINLAKRCKAPIYVNKQIILTDAIRIAYGTGRVHATKAVYDVLLDSPMEGPDLLVEELNLVQNIELAVKEERYYDAAMWRDKLVKLRHSRL